jgi:hopanoid biosynthesis associated RND transporter like protein HpnN
MLEKLVGFCLRWPWAIVALVLALSGGGAYLATTRFAIDTDTGHLFSPNILWRQNEAKLYKAFPQLDDLIIAVIDGQTPEKAQDAANRLTAALSGAPLISRVWRPDENDFFRSNGLLFLSTTEIRRITGTLIGERDVLQALAEDQSLRGLTGALLDNMRQIGGSQRGMAMFTTGLDELSEAFEGVLAGRPAKVSWEKMLSFEAPQPTPTPTAAVATTIAPDLRRIVLIKPVIDFSALQPGADAIALVRKTAAELKLTKDQGVTLRLTGQVPLADDEFATISENMGFNLSATLVVVALILFGALRSPKLIFAVLATLLAGLAATAGLGILLIGRFNMISVAFAALFIGLGVDFGIQFATRYREERHKVDGHAEGLDAALRAAARNIGGSLTLAAVSLLAGFFCFLPTDFRGVSELGLIAGFGMIIAYFATLTFLPALIKLLEPRAEKLPIETASLARVDHWIARHRAFVIVGSVVITVAGAPFLWRLTFDSNPMDLRNQKVESVATFLELSKDPQTAPNTIELLAPSLEAARTLSAKIAALPVVDHVFTVETLVPKDQDDKLPLIQNAALQLRGVLTPNVKPAPSDADAIKSLQSASKALRHAGARPPPAQAIRFADTLDALVKADAGVRDAARVAAFSDFARLIGDVRQALRAKRVTLDVLPERLAGDWISSSGEYRVEVGPKGDSNDRTVMIGFAKALQAIAPDASGPPIIVEEAGATVVRAFLEAGTYAFVAIFLILAIALRNAKDVALTLGPLLLAGVLSLETTDAVGMSLNFANIIALPLMFAVGVAFHIYYVIAWRKGIVDMLASSLTRAIFFSALTTGTAFGSLVLSSHPGTASMGALLTISLFFTLVAAFVVVPAFLGPPRRRESGNEGRA